MSKKIKNLSEKQNSSPFKLSTTRARAKAFIIDIFMIYVPLVYFFAYVVAGGVSDFKAEWVYPFVCFLGFGVIISIFLSTKAQTPGYKYTNLYIIDVKNKKKPSFFLVFFRFILFCFSYALLFGMIFVFLRKDKISFHDLITNTRILQKQGE